MKKLGGILRPRRVAIRVGRKLAFHRHGAAKHGRRIPRARRDVKFYFSAAHLVLAFGDARAELIQEFEDDGFGEAVLAGFFVGPWHGERVHGWAAGLVICSKRQMISCRVRRAWL